MKLSNLFGSILFFFVVYTIGFYWAKDRNRSTNQRIPAAIDRTPIHDFTELEGSALESAVLSRLINGSKIVKEPNSGEIGIAFGHFMMNDQNLSPKLACEIFDRISIKFEAVGVAESGERPSLVIDGPCTVSENYTTIRPIWIPVKDITGLNPNNWELTFDSELKVEIKTNNIGDNWPSNWSLSQIRLMSQNQEVSHGGFFFDSSAIQNASEFPMILEWESEKEENQNSSKSFD